MQRLSRPRALRAPAVERHVVVFQAEARRRERPHQRTQTPLDLVDAVASPTHEVMVVRGTAHFVPPRTAGNVDRHGPPLFHQRFHRSIHGSQPETRTPPARSTVHLLHTQGSPRFLKGRTDRTTLGCIPLHVYSPKLLRFPVSAPFAPSLRQYLARNRNRLQLKMRIHYHFLSVGGTLSSPRRLWPRLCRKRLTASRNCTNRFDP